MTQKLVTFLWFDGQAEQAVDFYCAVLKGAARGAVVHYGGVGPGEKGKVMTAAFEAFGVSFVGLNGGPQFTFSEAVSFQIQCEDQAEVDYYWDKLGVDGGQPGPCGWLKDRFGVSWQITPRRMPDLIGGPDKAKADRAMAAMMKMGKLDIAALEAAREG